MSKVANISSFWLIKLEFINSIDVFLSKPDKNRFSSIFNAFWLLCFAFSPEPIPSLKATKYFPSFSLIVNVLSPDVWLFSFVFSDIPIAITNLSSDKKFNLVPILAS